MESQDYSRTLLTFVDEAETKPYNETSPHFGKNYEEYRCG
jgi:hypothetical protein